MFGDGDGFELDGSVLGAKGEGEGEGEVELELWRSELIGDQSDANSDVVEFICAESESLDSGLESVFASRLA